MRKDQNASQKPQISSEKTQKAQQKANLTQVRESKQGSGKLNEAELCAAGPEAGEEKLDGERNGKGNEDLTSK